MPVMLGAVEHVEVEAPNPSVIREAGLDLLVPLVELLAQKAEIVRLEEPRVAWISERVLPNRHENEEQAPRLQDAPVFRALVKPATKVALPTPVLHRVEGAH